MPKSINQKLRIMYISRMLTDMTDEEHCLKTSDIISSLLEYGIEAERKTVYDDIEKLTTFGMDILKKSGKDGGYYLASRDFQLPEIKLMVDAVQASKFITKRKSEQLIKKLESLSGKYSAQTLSRDVYVINRVKTDNESIYYNVDKIHDAILNNSRITFMYYEQVVDFKLPQKHQLKPKRESAYNISPWALTWDDENYYLVGYDSKVNEIRHYRVDKMRDIKIVKAVRDGQELFDKFDMGTYAKSCFGMFGGDEKKVHIRFENKLIGVVVDRFGDNMYMSRADDNYFTILVNVKTSPVFYSWVFSFGSAAKILSPPEVADELEKQAKEICDLYKNPQ